MVLKSHCLWHDHTTGTKNESLSSSSLFRLTYLCISPHQVSLLLSLGRSVDLQLTGRKKCHSLWFNPRGKQGRAQPTRRNKSSYKKEFSWGCRSIKKIYIFEVPGFLHLNVWTNKGTTSQDQRWNNPACDVRGGVSSPWSHQAMSSLHITSGKHHI